MTARDVWVSKGVGGPPAAAGYCEWLQFFILFFGDGESCTLVYMGGKEVPVLSSLTACIVSAPAQTVGVGTRLECSGVGAAIPRPCNSRDTDPFSDETSTPGSGRHRRFGQ